MTIDGKERKRTFSDIITDLQSMKEDIAPLLEYRGYIGQTDYTRLQKYTICALMSGVWIPIPQVKQLLNIKIRNFNPSIDDFYDGTILAFQKPFYNAIQVPYELKQTIDTLLFHTPFDLLFMDNVETPLTIQRIYNIIHIAFRVSTKELFKIWIESSQTNTLPYNQDLYQNTT